MDGAQRIGQTLEVGAIAGVADVDVLSYERRTVRDRGQPADEDEREERVSTWRAIIPAFGLNKQS